jgi:hypothetical protein
MLTQILWWSCNALIACLLARAIQARFFTKYLIFYIYLSHVLALEFLRFYLWVFKSNAFDPVYWYTEFLSIAIGYCVVWEVYEQVLAAYPGTLRMARCIVSALFAIVLARAISNSLSGPFWGAAKTTFELERNVRVVQAALLVVLLIVLTYYKIPIGRNLRGVILGYGFFISMRVIGMTLRSDIGEVFQPSLRYFQSVAYLVTLLIWSAALWSYHPNPKPETEIEIERDYESLSAHTAQAVAKARGYLVRTVRP